MDGGRVLRSLLTRWRSEEDATRLAAAAGRCLAIVMGLVGLLAGNFLLMFVALFVYLGATQEAAAARGRALTAGVPVRRAMVTDFRTLAHGETLRAAGDLLLATSQQDFPVLSGGAVVGLLTRKALLRAMLAEGPDAYVAGAMDRQFARVAPDADLAAAMPLIAAPGGCALVMDGETLVGLLTAENLTEFLLLRQVRETRAALGAPA
jgi:CBS domain-containing protein